MKSILEKVEEGNYATKTGKVSLGKVNKSFEDINRFFNEIDILIKSEFNKTEFLAKSFTNASHKTESITFISEEHVVASEEVLVTLHEKRFYIQKLMLDTDW
ncbi:hypothetical protein [Clostridium beijerinckii]|jgi:hypothetical protein|uniref:Uncharacterized protein n=2 Tax=Clostridium beijerinckii TaxID=1520 RepID=A0AAE2RUW1_CLOBE|nr:hypothetical protein [Clostridium beijerinckii]ABR33637.1 methyl-accepting chemotaxis sensory transducer [Clostridium beijerinckii NCIMB 8052]AIU01237.1 methyl-accepting chemotaxis sensory transducer [Clostridium beijerinckii ATCC 35702]MBF7812053.1 hypothetical protein [Clostridium beijerinckii]NRT25092.1 hypothetical protein [Clostridium beijerinckii]NRT67314.1 hypothetical protein [Clostridium beijerinckii]